MPADHLARQEHHPRAGGALPLRHGAAAVRLPLRRPRRARHPRVHPHGCAGPGVPVAGARGAADRRDRQGRHRVPQRPAARTRPDAVHRHGDRRRGGRRAPARRHHHEQRGEGTARRVPAPMHLPLHRLPRPRADGADRRRAPPGPGPRSARAGPERVLRGARDGPHPQASEHQRTRRLDRDAADRRGGRRWPSTTHPVPRHAAEEGAGHGGVRQRTVPRRSSDVLPRAAVPAARPGRVPSG